MNEQNQFEASDSPEQTITLREYIDIVRRRRVIIGYSFLLIVIVGVIITLLTPPTYRATSLLLVKPSGLNLNQIDSANPLSGLFSAQQSYKIETQVRLLQSRELVDTVMKKVGASGKGGAAIAVKAVPDTDIIEVDVESGQPKQAAEVANTLLDTYITDTADVDGQQLQKALKFTEDGARKAQGDLEKAEDKLRQFEQQYKVTELDKSRESQITEVETLGTQYNDLQSKIAAANSQLATLRQEIAHEPKTESTVVSADADPTVQATETQIAGLDAERAGLAQRYTPINKQIVSLDAQIAALRSYLVQQRSQVAVRNQHKNPTYDAMLDRRALLEEQVSGLAAQAATLSQRLIAAHARLNEFPAWQQQMARLQRQMDIAKANYALLSDKREDLRLRDQTHRVDARVMEYATVPGAPVKPRKSVNILTAILLGLIVGISLGVIQEYLDDRINSQEEAERVFHLPTLGLLPMIAEEGIRLIKDTKTFSPLMESYRSLRTNIGFAAVDNPIRTLLITSTAPGEGKSTVAANLAMAMSLDGRKVVVVDADLRRPTQHKVFKLKQEPGLTDLLLGTHGLSEVLQQTAAEGVRLIAAGSHAPNPVELLASEAMARLIDSLRGIADVIIFDSPPVLAVSDSVMLSARVDGVLFVSSHAETRRGNARQALKSLTRARSHVIGAVLNKIDISNRGYYYSYSHYNYAPARVLENETPELALTQAEKPERNDANED